MKTSFFFRSEENYDTNEQKKSENLYNGKKFMFYIINLVNRPKVIEIIELILVNYEIMNKKDLKTTLNKNNFFKGLKKFFREILNGKLSFLDWFFISIQNSSFIKMIKLGNLMLDLRLIKRTGEIFNEQLY